MSTEQFCQSHRILRVEPFIPRDNPIDTGWEEWIEDIEREMRYFKIVEVQDKIDALLIFGGKEVKRLARILPDTDESDRKTNLYERLRRKLDDYFLPRKNERLARILFGKMHPLPGELTLHYATRLREKARLCYFKNEDERILEHILHTSGNKELIQNVFEKNWQLAEMLRETHAIEICDMQMKIINEMKNSERKTEAFVHSVKDQIEPFSVKNEKTASMKNEINATRKRVQKNADSEDDDKLHSSSDTETKLKKKRKVQKIQKTSRDTCCVYCGQDENHTSKEDCIAYGRKCYSCRKWHHLAIVCKSKSNTLDNSCAKKQRHRID